jgi:hypothetical protein
MRTLTVQIMVKVPNRTGEAEVLDAINGALDEPPCDWGNWTVGAAVIVTHGTGETEHDSADDNT